MRVRKRPRPAREDTPGGATDDRAAFLRDVNEIVAHTADRLGTVGAPWQFLCECGRRGCRETVDLTLDEYDHITAGGFLVAPKHKSAPADRSRTAA